MGETIDALGYKADVPARAKDKVTGTVGRARDSVAGSVDSLKGAVAGSAPSNGDAAETARHAVGVAQRNPMGLAIGSVAVGFLAGMLIPSTRVEDERIGPMADDVKEHAADVGHEALEHGKQVAKETAETAASSLGDSAAQHAEQLKESAQEHAQSVAGASDGPETFQGSSGERLS